MLQSAAVIGKVFWLGALTQMSGLDRHTAEAHLHVLERKDFVLRAQRSSVVDDAEYSFLHGLVRDVAYGQIPRGRRAEQHRMAAGWIATLGRTEDHAEMLAHHYLNALELGRAAGQGIDVVQGPTLNVERVPESGRDYEGFGEDPLLVADMGVADIEGIQSTGAMAMAKHFAVYSQETDRGVLDDATDDRKEV